jgi:predicted cupin superfamily sugar epimerase
MEGVRSMLSADDIIDLLQLEPLPIEGGSFRQTYRSVGSLPPSALPAGYAGSRLFGTAIYYLLRDGECSALHRLRSDEIYHFYLGQPVELLLLHPEGRHETAMLGTDLMVGQRPQVIVPHGVWQGAHLALPTAAGFALLGTTMAPGYDPADFELGDRDALLASYPQRAEEIRALTQG